MKKSAKSLLLLIILGIVSVLVAACGQTGGTPVVPPPADTPSDAPTTQTDDPAPPANEDGRTWRVGVSMPTRSLQRWNQDGENLENILTAAGFEVDLQFGGENEVPVQVAQIENMIAMGVDALVIAAIDAGSLTEVLAEAQGQGIVVISYDRLIMGTDAVTYYATFDNFLVGEMQGQFIADELDLANQEGPFYIEFFTGDPGDNNIFFFFPGAMSILQPFIDDGTLVVPSEQTEIMQVATPGWSTEAAQARMENLIALNNLTPDGHPLHAVMCSNDSTAQGVTNALVNAGFTADNIPIITGQDCDLISVRNMVNGLQAMSVFKDTRILADSVVEMLVDIRAGNQPYINDTTTFHNGIRYIPTRVNPPVIATIDNYRELLIDTGYYTEDQIHG